LNGRQGINKPLPKTQRQGAIIILGMLALAKRGVLTDHVDVMLKVGLGHLGKVRVIRQSSIVADLCIGRRI
jgi:hypothetical protein